MKKIKWGVIGTAGIARSCTIPGMQQADNCELCAIAGRNIDKAEQLKQSILKKAFEGRLVPQDPNDEPASVLLEKIKAERKNKCLIS